MLIAGAGTTKRFASDPCEDKFADSGHLTQRFSGVSRRSRDLTFGGTTLAISSSSIQFWAIQFCHCVCFRPSARAGRDCTPLAISATRPPPLLRFSLSPCMPIERGAQGFDDRRADHHRIGVCGDCGSASGVFHAKADATGNFVCALMRPTPKQPCRFGAAAPVMPVIET